jgi:predicted Holliday junction resolvase-like endonuclease
MEKMPKRKIRTIRFKMIHFVLVLITCVVILLAVLIPQRLRIKSARDEYNERVETLNQTKRTYMQERTNLEYMRTDEYKVQQGMSKYGWHYPADSIISDESTAVNSE